jgi:acyl carrier protein
MSERSVTRRLRILVLTLLEDSADPHAGIDDRAFLPDMLDSAALTRLIAMIEREWSFTIDDEELDLAHFENIHQLSGFIQRKLASPR